MKALRRIEAKLRGKRDRNARMEPTGSLDNTLLERSSQPPPIVNTEPEPEPEPDIRTNVSKLCDTCTKLLRLVCGQPDEWLPFPPNVAELDEPPPTDCPFCYHRWRMMPPTERAKLRGCRSMAISFTSGNHAMAARINIKYSYPVQPPKSGSYFSEITCITCVELDITREFSSSSSLTFSSISSWIDACNDTHGVCKMALQATLSASNFPAGRILDLQTSKVGGIRLVDGDDVEPHARYISLSHCWGAFVPPKLESTTLGQFQEGIDPATLPSTFVDAIDITKRLGIRYLWIDSMCIIQDNDDDWRIESAKMAQIYACAWLNIAATKAQDARGGCYSSRELRDVVPLVIGGLPFQPNHRYYSLPHFVLFNTNIWNDSIGDSLLMHRAWVQQEQLLSRRTIHFAKDQVFWRCFQLQACESFPAGMPDYGGEIFSQGAHQVIFLKDSDIDLASNFQQKLLDEWTKHGHIFEEWERQHHIPPEDHPQRELFKALKTNQMFLETWRRIVWLYSRCELTFPDKDKLVAISALARRFGRGCDYLAGLWRHTLTWQLLWHVEDNHDPQSVSRLLGLPSWSWASINRQVSMHHRLQYLFGNFADDIQLIRISAAETSLVGADPFGQVKEGVIALSGIVVHIQISTVQKMVANWGSRCTRHGWEHEIYSVDDVGLQHPENAWGYCLAVIKGTVDKFGVNVTAVQGLWIEPTGRRRGEYRRRGCFALPVEEGSQLWPDEFQKFLSLQLKPEEYEEYDGMESIGSGDDGEKYHRYRITLV